MIVINESPYLANVVKAHMKFPSDVLIVSTGGFLYDYVPNASGKTLFPRPKNLDMVSFLEGLSGETVIVATDLDPAGELISVEVCSLINPYRNEAYRLSVPFDYILTTAGKPGFDPVEWFLRNSVNGFDMGKASLYVKSETKKERNRMLETAKGIAATENVAVEFPEDSLGKLSEKFSEYL